MAKGSENSDAAAAQATAAGARETATTTTTTKCAGTNMLNTKIPLLGKNETNAPRRRRRRCDEVGTTATTSIRLARETR